MIDSVLGFLEIVACIAWGMGTMNGMSPSSLQLNKIKNRLQTSFGKSILFVLTSLGNAPFAHPYNPILGVLAQPDIFHKHPAVFRYDTAKILDI